MRTVNFAKRNFKEIIRDPLSIIFSILLPLFLLFIFQQIKIPNDSFNIENFTPGIIIFSFSFITLFTATLVAKDRSTSLLVRLCISPMRPTEYILGYILSVLPVVLIQNVLFFTLAILLGLNFSINIIFTILISLFISIFFIALGILIGCITTEKAASGVSSVIVQFVAFTSGMYFSTELVGDVFAKVCEILPFYSLVNITKGILNSNYSNFLNYFITFGIYFVIIIILTVTVFKKKMTSDK